MLHLFALALTLGCNFAGAYMIDEETCGPNAAWLSSVVFYAFDMIQGAITAVDTQRADPNVQRLIQLLFCTANDDPATVDLLEAMDSLRGSLTMSTLNPGMMDNVAAGADQDFVGAS